MFIQVIVTFESTPFFSYKQRIWISLKMIYFRKGLELKTQLNWKVFGKFRKLNQILLTLEKELLWLVLPTNLEN